MSFKTCRKCGYRFVPVEFDTCPKCLTKVSGPLSIKRLAFWGCCAVILGLATYGAIVLLPRISVTIN